MVLLTERTTKLCFKLENHHPHHHGHGHDHQESLQSFRSDVSNCLNQFLSNSLKSELEIPSLQWIHLCFQILPKINTFFAKLVVDLDYPMSKWGGNLMEEYLNFSLDLLDFLNCISSSLSHLDQSRIPLHHALNLLENSPSTAINHLNPIQVKKFNSVPKEVKIENRGDCEVKLYSGEEKVIHQALKEIQSIGFRICGILLFTLSGNAELYKEIKKLGLECDVSFSIDLDLMFSGVMVDEFAELKEVMEVNRAVEMVEGKGSDAAKELKHKLSVFEHLVDKLTKEVDGFFSEILESRNRLLDGVRHHNQ